MPNQQDKLYFLLDTINDARALSTSDGAITLHLKVDLKNKLNADEMAQAMNMLEEKHLAHVLTKPVPANPEQFSFAITASARQIKAKIPGYAQYRIRSAAPAATPPANEGPAYTVTYDEHTREILVNGMLLAKPDFNSENEVFFTYLYAHPNERISLAILEKEYGEKFKKSFSQIQADLGFKGDYAKMFFSASKQMVLFRNPVTFQHLENAGITRLKIQK